MTINNVVSIVKVEGTSRIPLAVKKAINLSGTMEKVVSKGDKVLIKPNLVCARSAETGTTTSPLVVRTLVEMSYQQGASEVIIAESSNWGIDTEEVFKICGYNEIVKQTGARLLDLKRDKIRRVKIPHGVFLKNIRLPNTFLEADVIINVPVLKVHNQTYISLSLKNIVGICPDEEKERKMHSIGLFSPICNQMMKQSSGLDHAIAEVNSVKKPDLIVVDGIVGQQGMGAPLCGEPVNMNIIVSGSDSVAVDTVCCAIMGYDSKEIPHIKISYQRNLGEINLNKINVIGESIEEIKHDFKPGVITELNSLCPKNLTIVIGKACYSCISAFAYFLSKHSKDISELGPITVTIGKIKTRRTPILERRRLLIYGNCAGENMYGGGFVPGCPPRSRRQVLQALGILDVYVSFEGVKTKF